MLYEVGNAPGSKAIWKKKNRRTHEQLKLREQRFLLKMTWHYGRLSQRNLMFWLTFHVCILILFIYSLTLKCIRYFWFPLVRMGVPFKIAAKTILVTSKHMLIYANYLKRRRRLQYFSPIYQFSKLQKEGEKLFRGFQQETQKMK